jgi:hypothetical protein
VALAEATKPVAGTAHPTPKAKASPRFYFALLGGTGVGTASGTAEVTRENVSSSIAWTRAGQLAPEIGYFLTPQLRLGVQARLQLVTGATSFHLLAYDDANECGADHTCAPFTGAFAGLAKASWSFFDPESVFQLYASMSAGYGTIRHVVTVSSAPPSCGGTPPLYTGTCKDTVPGGPVLFGPGVGFQYRVSDGVGLVVELDALVGAPHFTANADLNVGVAFEL